VKRQKSTTSAADFVPPRPTIAKMRAASQRCRGCDLYKCATQAVFSEGSSRAQLLVIGEQPGDAEDRAGRPFVGPSGKLFDRALEAAGIDRDEVYVTNAVKHFKWARDAKSTRRIHKTPSRSEVRACFPWLANEIALVQPRIIVCLGAVAAKALLGPTFSVTKKRGVVVKSEWADAVITTVHPSAVLRAPRDERVRAERMFIADLRKVARELAKPVKRAERGAHKFSGWPIPTAVRSTPSSESIRPSRA
jgi:uracil-DNA glycosylase family protein